MLLSEEVVALVVVVVAFVVVVVALVVVVVGFVVVVVVVALVVVVVGFVVVVVVVALVVVVVGFVVVVVVVALDICMAFDECIENPAPYDYVARSVDRTYRWLVRCKAENARLNALPDTVNPQQMLWGINQGGTYADLRIRHMQQIAELDLPGYAIGGLAVGESTQTMYDIIDAVEPYMPKDKTRYLMGVGTPSNIIEGVARGVDFFDCVMPARNARHAKLFTWEGAINLKNAKYERDMQPIDPACDCPVCRRYSRAYLRHLFKAEEMLAMRLSVMHNLYFYNKLMERIRQALDEGRFEEFRRTYSERLDRRI